MPTQDKLAGLYDSNKKNRHGYHVTDSIEVTECCPWASETHDRSAAVFTFYDGGSPKWVPYSFDGFRALPVRSGK